MKNNQKISRLQLTIAVFASCLSALGTIPYSYRFFENYKIDYPVFFIVSGIVLGSASGIANAALGTYSLLSLRNNKLYLYLLIATLLSAVPTGMMYFYAYQELLPLSINAVMTLIVIAINGAIGYTAINNLTQDVKKLRGKKLPLGEYIARFIGFLIGLAVSLTAFVAAMHGLTSFYGLASNNHLLIFRLSFITALITWVPYAALYSYSTQWAGQQLYSLFAKGIKNLTFEKLTLILFVIAFFSGFSYAKIAMDFFRPEMHIPLFFKTGMVQYLIYTFLIPCAFASSVSVNYFALKNLILLARGRSQ